MGDRDKKLALAICEYLEGIEETMADQEKVEGLQLARECITDAFDLASAQSLSIKPTKLTSIFDAYLRTQVSAPAATVSAVESGINALDVSDTPKESEDDLKKRAEAHKARGNKEMTVKNYEGAIQAYTDAIAIDGKNPVYYANRAAAHSQNDAHERAVDDSKTALKVDPKYSKAYSRMGHAYFCIEKYKEAVKAYKDGLKLDPENAIMKQSLATAQIKLNEASSVTAGAGAPPAMPGMGGMGGMDFASMMSNPNFMQMASQMMSNPAMSQMMNNPAMKEMAQSMMSDPDALANAMKMMGGANGGGQ